MNVIVCGSRTWSDSHAISDALKSLDEKYGDQLVVFHGDHWEGADAIADRLCKELGVNRVRCPANWIRYSRSAGPRRNRFMWKLAQPDMVLAFRSSGKSDGTDNMISIAEKAGVEVRVESETAS